MPKQKPAGNAQWTQQKANDRAAERKAVRQFEKFAKEQDPRTDFQKASDARHEAQSRSAAGKGLAVLPNTAGDPLALAAALTRAALDKCQPAWKAEPVAPARKVIPVADRKTVMPLEVSPDVRNQDADDPLPLFREFDISVLDHSGPTVKVMSGTWMNIRQTGATDDGTRDAYHALTVADGDKIYLKLDYHMLSSLGTLTVLAGAAVPNNVPGDGLFYRQLGTVSIAGGLISISQTLWGPLEYSGRWEHLREFDVSALGEIVPYVRIMAGTWMGIKGTGGTYAPGRTEYFTAAVAHGDTVYVKLNKYAATPTLTYHAGTMPADAPEQGLFYTALATISIAAGRIAVTQTRWGPLEYLPGEHREFRIEPSSAYYVKIYNGTLFGSMPAGFSVNDSPIFTLPVANNDKIYAKVTWDRRVKANGDIVSTISGRTIAAAAAVPADDNLTATRHYQLATVTLGAGNIPVVSQSRWGPIDDLPGTAYANYYTNSGTTAQVDYWDLTLTGKGKQADGTTDIAPSYDSIQLTGGAFMRAEQSGTNLLLFARTGTLNSQGQFTYASAETKVFDKPVVCETTVNVLVGLRLNGTELQGQYRTITVNAVATPSPDWVKLIDLTTSGTTIDVS